MKSGCCRVVVPGCCKVVEQMVADGDRGRPRVAGGVAGRWRCRSRTKNSIAVGRTIVSGRRLAGEKEKGRTFCSTFSVELPGLEPGKTGPESVVLPLHHSSMVSDCGCKFTARFSFEQVFSQKKIIFVHKILPA